LASEAHTIKTTGDLAPVGAFIAYLERLKAPTSLPLLPHL
jgi:hypothetical protein